MGGVYCIRALAPNIQGQSDHYDKCPNIISVPSTGTELDRCTVWVEGKNVNKRQNLVFSEIYHKAGWGRGKVHTVSNIQ